MNERHKDFEPGMAFAISIIVVGFLLQFAWRFADERLYADSGYYLFHVVNGEGFHVEHGRWVLAIAELPALLGVKFGAGMGAVIRLHSLANVLFLVLALGYCYGVLKDHRAAVTVAMTQVLGLTHGLFCPVFELYYGVGLIILLYATLCNSRLNGWIKLGLASLLFVLALSSHPMAWPLLFGGSMLLDRQDLRPFLLPAVLLAVGFAILRWSNMSIYESAQLGFVQRLAFPSLVFGLFTPAKLLEQTIRVLQHYPDVIVLALFTILICWRNGQRRVALVGLIGMLALYLLIGLYLPDPTHDRYREQVDFAFSAWTLMLMLSRGWGIERWRPILLILLVVCVAYRVTMASSMAPYYETRTHWHEEHIERARAQGLHKVIIDPMGIAFGTVHDRVAPYWSSGVESLLLSAKDGPEHTVSVITTDDLQCPGVPENLDKVVLRCWDILEPGALNPRYFRLDSALYTPLLGASR